MIAAAMAGMLVMAGHAQDQPVAIEAEVPAGLLEAAVKLRPGTFYTLPKLHGNLVPKVGFFIDDNGLALCPLEPLHVTPVPVFRTGERDSDILKNPVVLEVFPDQSLALLKFDHKPSASLKIAKEAAKTGTWVAAVPSGLTDGGSVAGPIVSHRIANLESQTSPPRPPQKQFLVAVGSGPVYRDLLRPGAPMINERGEVVATYSGSQVVPGQTLQLASPLETLPARIEEAVKNPNRRSLPLALKDLGLDPAILSEEFLLFHQSASQGDASIARNLARKLVETFPASRAAKSNEFGFTQGEVGAGTAHAHDLLDLAKRMEPPESATALEMAAHHVRLGEALLLANRLEEGVASLLKSEELDSEAMACVILAGFYEARGELELAEKYWRQATTLEQERISYWDALERVLGARGKWKEAAAAQERVYLLEDLYRTR
jgi:hypothetical protein